MAGNPGALVLRREDDGEVLCERCVVADTTFRRLRGLLGRRDLRPGEGIVLRPGWSIHTAFLLFSIDVAFVDADQVVLKVVENLRPFRASFCRGARDVVELSAGEAERRGLKAGDRLTWAARGVNGAVPASEGIPAVAGQAPIPVSPVRPIRVLLASRDDDFMRLAHFLLTRNGFTVETTKKISQAVDLVGRFWLDVVVLDASESLSEAARTVAAIEALHPQVSVLLVSDDERPKPNAALHVADKWEAMETLTEDIRRAHTSATK
jgi:uncharacterized membrane protein (UPF0127 family)/CheY-like chemotaxis protein